MKLHELKTIIINHAEITYFYKREKNDINGNPRFRVYILDHDAPAVYETIFKTYENLIPERVRAFVKTANNV